MTEQTMKTFLNRLIRAYPGYKVKIIDQRAFVQKWMEAFGNRSEEDMMDAAQLHIDHNRFFPTTEEFNRTLMLIDFRRTQERQAEYERTHPTSEADQRRIDAVIHELFEKEDDT